MLPTGADIILLHVTGRQIPGAARGAFAGLLGRGIPSGFRNRRAHLAAAPPDSSSSPPPTGSAAPAPTFNASAALNGRSSPRPRVRSRSSWTATATAPRPGPKIPGSAGRFVVDHAPCPVLLVRPDPAPGLVGIRLAPPYPPYHRWHGQLAAGRFSPEPENRPLFLLRGPVWAALHREAGRTAGPLRCFGCRGHRPRRRLEGHFGFDRRRIAS